MKRLPLYMFIAIGILLCNVAQIKAEVTDEQVRQNLEQSRNTLLKQEDDLKRNYLDTVTAIDNLTKQLDQLNQRKLSMELALQRNNQSLKDIEYSLRNLH